MSRRRKKPNKPPLYPKKAEVVDWADSMTKHLAGTLVSQQEELRSLMRAMMLHGGWSPKAADAVMTRIPPDSDAPTTEREVLIRVYPWMARLSDGQRQQCIADLSQAIGDDPPQSVDTSAMRATFTYWREIAEG